MAEPKPILERVKLPLETIDQLHEFVRSRLPRFRPPTDAAKWTREAARLRREALRKIYLRGWPGELIKRKPPVVWGEVLHPDPSYVIRKLRYEIYPDYWVPALLYEPTELRGRVPAVLNPNGHHPGGKATTYKQARCINLARRGMLALNFEFIGMGELGGDRDHDRLAFLDVTGMASVGFFYLAMSKGLDILLEHPHADRKRVAMTGLSGGGWQTIGLSALDTRIKLCVPVAGYTSVRVRTRRLADLGDLEQLPPDLTTVLGFQDMTAMLAPRPTLQILNEKDDCCFRPDLSKLVIYDMIRPTYRAYGASENFEFHNNTDPGIHNYEADNRSQLYRFLAKHFDLDIPLDDMHHENEILTEPELNVGLLPGQLSTMAVARARAYRMAAELRTPGTKAEKAKLRRKVAEVIRLPSYKLRAIRQGRSGRAELFRLKVGPWTLPAARFEKSDARRVEFVLSDNADAAATRVESVKHGRVIVVDVFGVGRCRCLGREQTLINTCGERAIGVQTAQILAAVRFALRGSGAKKVHITGLGMRSGFAALVAAALEPQHFESVLLAETTASLCYLFDTPPTYEQVQSILCPDFLEVADVPQLISLLDGVKYITQFRAVRPIT